MADEHNQSDMIEELGAVYEILETHMPSSLKVQIKEADYDSEKIIGALNGEIVNLYLNAEGEHIKQQKPVGVIIAVAVGLQLIAFNVLIYLVALIDFDIEKLTVLLEFMKYYTGAVIVEMLGLCLFIIKGIFNSNLGKMVEHVLGKKNQNKHNY